jgi:aspartate carbamoyltransferase catalytic subunit
VINAGDGDHAHPTQGLLDAYTLRRHKGHDFSRLVVLLVGDVLHSRVARSDLHALATLGAGEVRVCGPEALLPATLGANVRVFHELDRALRDVDAVMMLRLQKERMQQATIPDEADYFRRYGLSPQRLRLAKPDAIVMHPGPMNRGVEIASEVADGPQSVILEQVSNGLVVRMAVMAKLIGAGA